MATLCNPQTVYQAKLWPKRHKAREVQHIRNQGILVVSSSLQFFRIPGCLGRSEISVRRGNNEHDFRLESHSHSPTKTHGSQKWSELTTIFAKNVFILYHTGPRDPSLTINSIIIAAWSGSKYPEQPASALHAHIKGRKNVEPLKSVA